ncbi:metallophosphoesterase family protein [Acidicapsa ligni]|uniref:metallophosphoesterase family protein n=1 Tax=Acidicapsa ligni TaxID=542300 RepID=UPI0021E02B70|nr:metallophosphoesterase [Acidicapsa ligni]
MNRRQFSSLGAGALGAALTQQLWARETQVVSAGRYFYFAVVADTHIIDPFYKGPENSPEDTESVFLTSKRLTSARELINSLQPKIEKVFLVGDYFHDYPSKDYDFYFQNKTRLDYAKELTDGFTMPVHVGFGNHDYSVPDVSREMSHRLFAAKFQLKPYYAIDHKGWKFIHLNNALGSSWTPTSNDYNLDVGSYGEEQLNWFESQLREHKPTFVFTHFPLWQCTPTEVKDYGLHPLLRQYQETIQLVVTGHWHKWIDFAHTFGPQHYVMAATRYDENAYMLMEVDTQKQTWRFVNAGLVEWSTHYSRPYRLNLRS